MKSKVSVLAPCVTFFSAGRTGEGFLILAMQLSLIFWPAAIRRARDFHGAGAMQKTLDALSLAYKNPVNYARVPQKRFRGHEAANLSV